MGFYSDARFLNSTSEPSTLTSDQLSSLNQASLENARDPIEVI